MLIKQPQVRIVSKETILPTGEAVLAFFALITIEGQTEVRFLGTKPLKASAAGFEAPAAPLLLDGCCEMAFGEVPVKEPANIASPFFSLDFLFSSQPTRAPALA